MPSFNEMQHSLAHLIIGLLYPCDIRCVFNDNTWLTNYVTLRMSLVVAATVTKMQNENEVHLRPYIQNVLLLGGPEG